MCPVLTKLTGPTETGISLFCSHPPLFSKDSGPTLPPRAEKQKVSVFNSPRNHSGVAQMRFFPVKACAQSLLEGCMYQCALRVKNAMARNKHTQVLVNKVLIG